MSVRRQRPAKWAFVIVFSVVWTAMLYAFGRLRDPVWSPLPVMAVLILAGYAGTRRRRRRSDV